MTRSWGLMLAVVMVIAACSGSDDSAGGGSSDSPDPCEIPSETTLSQYFATIPEPERSSAGPISSCTWRDDNANSFLVQTATNYELFVPESCDDCIALSFGDDGFATAVSIQATATVISGSNWYSVTTTGFRDDEASIAALAKSLFDASG